MIDVSTASTDANTTATSSEPATAALPFGTWTSPLAAEAVAAGGVRIGGIGLDDATVYWTEGRPREGGREVIVRWDEPSGASGADDPSGERRDVIPAPWNARTRVHEYGGGAHAVADGTVVFSHDGDGRLYRIPGDGAPVPITPAGADRYADLVIDRRHRRVIAVRERPIEGTEPVNALVAIPLDGGEAWVIFGEADFVSSPAVHPHGTALAWLAWDHPDMPWDGTTLWRADVATDGRVGTPVRVAGGPGESLFQPSWSPDGDLFVVSDRTDWWNLYGVRGADFPGGAADLVPVWPGERESGLPQWVFGLSTYAFVGPDRVAIAATEGGTWSLWLVGLADGAAERLDLPFTEIGDVHAGAAGVVFTAGSPNAPIAVYRWEARSRDIMRLSAPTASPLPDAAISRPEAITYPTGDGQVAHAFYYPPTGPGLAGMPGERPPLIVESHGGPTGSTVTTYEARTQFWTSRGFALLDVNYRGSTGYGRPYREALNGAWGVADVDDCVAGAMFLVEQGLADPERLIIRGSSASGYTTLAALAFRDTFRAGASLYGISDLEAMTRDTHKFESRYLDRLVGPYPETRDRYRERSPIHHVEGFSCPLIVLQGLEDKVVPPDQAEMIVEAVRARGLPVAYVPFPGEQHGFRRAETVVRALEAELSFYGQVFGFTPAGEIEPVTVENLAG